MYLMLVTADKSHFDTSWLKANASENIDAMLVTADTSHLDISWLNLSAPVNIDAMSVTADTSHFDRSWLKVEAEANIRSMYLTADTSQSPIDPCGPSEKSPIGDILIHSSTAAWSSDSDCGLNAAGS